MCESCANYFDKFETEIFTRDFFNVQADPIIREVHKKEDGELYFKPFEKEDKVSAYLKNNLIKIYQ